MLRWSVVALFLAGLSSAARAAPPRCDPKGGVVVDCLRDDVLVLDGGAMVAGHPLVTDPTGMAACTDPAACQLDYPSAVTRALTVAGAVAPAQWDEVVVFGQQIAPAMNPPAPLFHRDGYSASAGTSGVNEVAGIGLPVVARARPLIGYISAGSTSQPGTKNAFQDPVTGSYAPCGKAPANPTLPVPKAMNPALCFPGFYNYFDALAQATGAIYGPYLNSAPTTPPEQNLTVEPLSKPGMAAPPSAGGAPRTLDDTVLPKIWNSFLNLGGSLMAGNYLRDDGNGTFETAKARPFYGINNPYSAGWKAGTNLDGTEILRFQPLDLYVMGLLPDSAPELGGAIPSLIGVTPDEIYRPAGATGFSAQAGPEMGLVPGVVLRPVSGLMNQVMMSDVVAWNGARQPAFDKAPHVLEQLWVVVTKPTALIDKTAVAGDPMNDAKAKEAAADKEIDNVTVWRRMFPSYYYMLTSYRGRLVSTFDGVEDNAYWEFGQPVDDVPAWTVTDPAVKVVLAGPEPIPSSPEVKTVLRITAVAHGAGVKYSGPPLRITGDQTIKAPLNAVTIRMRIPADPSFPRDAFATVSFPNGPTVRIPASCGNPAKAGCTEAAFLIPDGNWRNYSASLTGLDAYTKGTFDSLTFSPSSADWTSANPARPAADIEVDSIRVGNLAGAGDNDSASCIRCGDCAKLEVAAARDSCTKQCAGKGADEKASGLLQPDGWLDSNDNCPTVYNPGQEDGNGDGVGDACEDFDGDGILNACDNCPTETNSRQQDSTHSGLGDVCNPGYKSGSCFLTPDAVAGPVRPSPVVAVGGLAAVVGLLAFRRRRRR